MNQKIYSKNKGENEININNYENDYENLINILKKISATIYSLEKKDLDNF